MYPADPALLILLLLVTARVTVSVILSTFYLKWLRRSGRLIQLDVSILLVSGIVGAIFLGIFGFLVGGMVGFLILLIIRRIKNVG